MPVATQLLPCWVLSLPPTARSLANPPSSRTAPFGSYGRPDVAGLLCDYQRGRRSFKARRPSDGRPRAGWAMASPAAAAAGAPPGKAEAQGAAQAKARPPLPLPNTMARVDAAAYGPPAKVLSVTTGVPLPPPPSPGKLLVAVEAVSLSPSDYRMLSGDTAWAKRLPGGSFPYTPGGDVAGTIVGVHPADAVRWAVGTTVVATWDMCGTGGAVRRPWRGRRHRIPGTELGGAAVGHAPLRRYF